MYAKLYKTEELSEADSNEDETVYNVTYFIKIGTCDYSRRGKRALELDKKYKPYQCLGGVEINHLNGNDNINMEYCVKEYWNIYDEDYSRVIVNGQATDRANIYEYKHWIDFKNKLNKLDYLYHNEEETPKNGLCSKEN